MTLTEFLLARIAEDEMVAQTAEASAESPRWDRLLWTTTNRAVPCAHGGVVELGPRGSVEASPSRVLSECRAKRALLAIHAVYEGDGLGRCGACADTYCVTPWDGLCEIAKPLAAVYADHPDYDPEWRG